MLFRRSPLVFFGSPSNGQFSISVSRGGGLDMALLAASNWPLVFICGAMIASAIIDWWKFKVPNWLTFPVIISGWILGLVHSFGGHLVAGDGAGGIGASLAGTALGLALLLPMYVIGGMGAGDVKMTMGFGSWAGAFYGLDGGLCLWVIVYAFCAGALVGGVIAVGMILARRQFSQNLQHTRVILLDFVTSGSLSTLAERANQRRPRWHRLPYGVPLCIGFVGYLWWAGAFTPPAEARFLAPIHQAIPVDSNWRAALAASPRLPSLSPTRS
jgi:prepilin peptidase CpaA